MTSPENVSVVIVRGEGFRRFCFNPPLSDEQQVYIERNSNFGPLVTNTEHGQNPPFAWMVFVHRGLEDPAKAPMIEEEMASDIAGMLDQLHCVADVTYAAQTAFETGPNFNPFAEVANP